MSIFFDYTPSLSLKLFTSNFDSENRNTLINPCYNSALWTENLFINVFIYK